MAERGHKDIYHWEAIRCRTYFHRGYVSHRNKDEYPIPSATHLAWYMYETVCHWQSCEDDTLETALGVIHTDDQEYLDTEVK